MKPTKFNMHTKIFLFLVTVQSACILGCKDYSKHKNWGLLTKNEKTCGMVKSPLSLKKFGAKGAKAADLYTLNGISVKLGALPWMVHVKHFHDGISDGCGGSIISNRYILTAAHCCVSKLDQRIVHQPKNVKVYSQQPNKKDWFWKIFQVESVIPHKDFKLKMGEHDICLIRLADELKFSDYQKPICLPTSCEFEKKDFENVDFTIVSWGQKNEGGETAVNHTLRKFDVVSTTRLDCERKWKTQISVYKICTWGYAKKNKNVLVGPSDGDSGGPLMFPMKGKTFAIAVVSFKGHSDGKGDWKKQHLDFPQVNTRVTPYIQWILENIKP